MERCDGIAYQRHLLRTISPLGGGKWRLAYYVQRIPTSNHLERTADKSDLSRQYTATLAVLGVVFWVVVTTQRLLTSPHSPTTLISHAPLL